MKILLYIKVSVNYYALTHGHCNAKVLPERIKVIRGTNTQRKELRMSVFMNWLREELGKISEDEIEVPNNELEDGDKAVGTLESIEARKIHELRSRVIRDMTQQLKDASHKAIDAIEEEMSGDHDPASCERCVLRRQLELLKDKKDMLDKLFWSCVRHELSEDARIESDKMGSDGVGIRKDWQIVLTKREVSLGGILLGLGLPI